ncbi:leucine-rich repeat-containing C10orf11-like protein [Labeo rohita]|uniref:Leucine-rich repeat-containing C10orf11-like protein n=1 Tax=Labeo rohita TaxID=84645 RepID=A0A498N2S6_LABRO|nr:leucine-rich repeat-containing C10orf11-like protein [Labeo rohita]
MAYNESEVVVNGSQVSCIGHDWEDIPDFLGEKYGEVARRLDLSFNQLRVRYRTESMRHQNAPTLEEREEVGYPHEPPFSDRQPRLPLHRQYASDLRRVCVNKIKGFRRVLSWFHQTKLLLA